MNRQQIMFEMHTQLRKQKNEQLFQKRRRELIIANPSVFKMHFVIEDIEKRYDNNNYTLTLEDLKCLRELSNLPIGAESIKKSKLVALLPEYLNEDQLNTPQQLEATWIICHLFYIESDSLPNQVFLEKLLNLLAKADSEIQQNCMFILAYILHDYQQVRDFLIDQLGLIDIMFVLLNNSPTLDKLPNLLKVLLYMLKNNPTKREGFKKFSKFLYSCILQSGDNSTISLSTYCLSMLLKVFPDQFKQELQHLCLFKILMQFCQTMDSVNFTKNVIDILNSHFELIIKTNLKTEFFRLIRKLVTDSLCKKKGEGVHNELRNVKHLGLTTLYNVICDNKNYVYFLVKDELFKELLALFQITQDKEMMIELTYIFCMVMLRHEFDDKALEESIMKLIKKTEQANTYHKEISTYLIGFYEAYENENLFT